MEDICIQLDKLTVEFFDNLELLQEKRENLNAAIRDGHLNLSKARYSMGNKSVGALQYSHKMDYALYHVRNEQPMDSSFILELQKTLPGKVMVTSETGVHENDEEKNVLRRRKPQNSDNLSREHNEITAIEELSYSKEEELALNDSSNGYVQDPLKWFGILVPGCLKTGQKNFQSAIELSCEVANLEAKAREIIGKFEVCKRRKKEVIFADNEKLQEIET